MITFETVDPSRCDWERLDALPDRVVFQTREWLDFLVETQGGEPVVARVFEDGQEAGWFTGMVVRRFGIKILGSPFPGWTTGSLGFNLDPHVDRVAAAEALRSFAWKELGCLHLELKDRRLLGSELEQQGFASTPTVVFEVSLTESEEAIFDRMTSPCRRAIRKSVKDGVVIERAEGIDFADEYYAQLVEVFDKQSLHPPYDVGRVRALIEHLHPTGRLLLLRARGPAGDSIATGIFPALNDTAYFWGGASWREHQIHRPNEAVFWHAMRYWRGQGIRVLDMGGGGDYKRKYGPVELSVPFFRTSRVRGLPGLRNLAARVLSPV